VNVTTTTMNQVAGAGRHYRQRLAAGNDRENEAGNLQAPGRSPGCLQEMLSAWQAPR